MEETTIGAIFICIFLVIFIGIICLALKELFFADYELIHNIKDENNKDVKLNLTKEDEKEDLYNYTFPELLKQRYMKERSKSEADYQLVQLALKD